MSQVGAYEAKTRLSQLLDRAAVGEEITIMRHGKAVARLGPAQPRIEPSTDASQLNELLQLIDELRAELATAKRPQRVAAPHRALAKSSR